MRHHDYFFIGFYARTLMWLVVVIGLMLVVDLLHSLVDPVSSSLDTPLVANAMWDLGRTLSVVDNALSVVGWVLLADLVILALVARKKQVKLIKSVRYSHFLRRALRMDLMPDQGSNVGQLLQSLSAMEKRNRRVNRELRKATVVIRKNDGEVMVPLPIEVESQQLITKNIDMAVHSLSIMLEMGVSAGRHESLGYQIMITYHLTRK